jgi:hypothetical protein
MSIEVYEIKNTWANDLTLDQQIAHGINDWRAESEDAKVNGGFRVAFGHSKQEAIDNLLA